MKWRNTGAKPLNGSFGPESQIVPDPEPVKCLKGTRTFRTQMTGPECWDPNFWDPSVETLHPRTQMKGPKCWEPSGTLRVPRSEALNGSPKFGGTLRVSMLLHTPQKFVLFHKFLCTLYLHGENAWTIWSFWVLGWWVPALGSLHPLRGFAPKYITFNVWPWSSRI